MLKRLSKAAGEALDFPNDITEKGPKITIVGCNEIIVEYYEEVLEFSDQSIELATKERNISMTGNGFVLTAVLPTEIHIKGTLHYLSFGERED